MRIVDPNRVRQVERDAVDALAVARHEVDALADGLLDAGGAAAARDSGAALEHVDGAEVERRFSPLRVQEPRVPCAERFEEAVRPRHGGIVGL